MFSDSNVNLVFIPCRSHSLFIIFVPIKYKKVLFLQAFEPAVPIPALSYSTFPVARLDFVSLIKGQTCALASPLAGFSSQNKS